MTDSRENFDYFSNEYAQALQALSTIESQASTILVMGANDELRGFIDQFLSMATRTKALADDRGETRFAEWFAELIGKAETLRETVAQR